jgi:hypothetical protein
MLVLTESRILCFAGVFAYTAVLFWSVMTGPRRAVRQEAVVTARRRLGVVGVVIAGGLMVVVGL